MNDNKNVPYNYSAIISITSHRADWLSRSHTCTHSSARPTQRRVAELVAMVTGSGSWLPGFSGFSGFSGFDVTRVGCRQCTQDVWLPVTAGFLPLRIPSTLHNSDRRDGRDGIRPPAPTVFCVFPSIWLQHKNVFQQVVIMYWETHRTLKINKINNHFTDIYFLEK